MTFTKTLLYHPKINQFSVRMIWFYKINCEATIFSNYQIN